MRVESSVQLLANTPSPETTIALAAKLCYSDSDIPELRDGLADADVSKFIRMLKNMGHLSPFEHVSFTFGIEGVSRSLLAQITRHRIASFSVKSQRYVAANKKGVFNYIIPPAIEALGVDAVAEYEAEMRTMHGWYEAWQSRLGGSSESANEDARFVLPNAAETKMIVTMNVRELYHFFLLRCCNRAQWEIRDVAWKMLALSANVAPALFDGVGPSCVAGMCSEGRMSCGKAAEIKEKRKNLSC